MISYNNLGDAIMYDNVVKTKTETLPYVSYSSQRFKRESVIFGKDVPKLSWQYSDRLREFDYDKHDKAMTAASENNESNTAAWWEAYLSFYFDADVEIVCIMGVADKSSGHPIHALGYRVKGEKKNDQF